MPTDPRTSADPALHRGAVALRVRNHSKLALKGGLQFLGFTDFG